MPLPNKHLPTTLRIAPLVLWASSMTHDCLGARKALCGMSNWAHDVSLSTTPFCYAGVDFLLGIDKLK